VKPSAKLTKTVQVHATEAQIWDEDMNKNIKGDQQDPKDKKEGWSLKSQLKTKLAASVALEKEVSGLIEAMGDTDLKEGEMSGTWKLEFTNNPTLQYLNDAEYLHIIDTEKGEISFSLGLSAGPVRAVITQKASLREMENRFKVIFSEEEEKTRWQQGQTESGNSDKASLNGFAGWVPIDRRESSTTAINTNGMDAIARTSNLRKKNDRRDYISPVPGTRRRVRNGVNGARRGIMNNNDNSYDVAKTLSFTPKQPSLNRELETSPDGFFEGEESDFGSQMRRAFQIIKPVYLDEKMLVVRGSDDYLFVFERDLEADAERMRKQKDRFRRKSFNEFRKKLETEATTKNDNRFQPPEIPTSPATNKAKAEAEKSKSPSPSASISTATVTDGAITDASASANKPAGSAAEAPTTPLPVSSSPYPPPPPPAPVHPTAATTESATPPPLNQNSAEKTAMDALMRGGAAQAVAAAAAAAVQQLTPPPPPVQQQQQQQEEEPPVDPNTAKIMELTKTAPVASAATPAPAESLPTGETDPMLAAATSAANQQQQQNQRPSAVQEVVTHAPPEKSRLLESLVMRMRGETLVTDETLEVLVRELEATNPIAEPSKSELLQGTWEVIYTSIPHLTRLGYEGWTLTRGALVMRQKNANIPRSYIEDSSLDDYEEYMLVNKVVGEQEDAVNAMYAAVAHVYIQTVQQKAIDMRKGKDSLPSPPVRTTYLDMNMRILRTEEGGSIVLCKTEQTRFVCL